MHLIFNDTISYELKSTVTNMIHEFFAVFFQNTQKIIIINQNFICKYEMFISVFILFDVFSFEIV